jgi:hypothetical protein
VLIVSARSNKDGTLVENLHDGYYYYSTSLLRKQPWVNPAGGGTSEGGLGRTLLALYARRGKNGITILLSRRFGFGRFP